MVPDIRDGLNGSGRILIMPIVYCQLFSEEKLLADRLLASIDGAAGSNAKDLRRGTFRVPEDQPKMIRADQRMRLDFPENVARRLKIANGNSLHIVARQIHGRIVQFGEAFASER
jgi:hypothetical protein